MAPSSKRVPSDPTAPGAPAAKKPKTQKQPSKANITDATAGLSAEQKFQQQLPELEADRQTRITAAKRENTFIPSFPDYGVHFLQRDAQSEAIAIIAGYLNCPDAETVWTRFVDDKTVEHVLKALHDTISGIRAKTPGGEAKAEGEGNETGTQDGKEGDGGDDGDQVEKAGREKQRGKPGQTDKAKSPPKGRLQKRGFFSRLKQGFFKAPDVLSDGDPPTSRFEEGSAVRLELYYLRAAHKIINLVPHSFPGPATTAVSQKYVKGIGADGLGLEAEDIHRFLVLFSKFYEVRVLKKTKGKKARIREDAQLPIFCLPGEAQVNTAEQAALNELAIDNLRNRRSTADLRLRAFHFADESEAAQQPEALDQVGSQKIVLHPLLPKLEEKDQKRLVELLRSPDIYLYNHRDRANKFLLPDALADMQKSVMQTATEEVKTRDAREALSVAEDKTFDQGAFRALQQQLNSSSAGPPSWQQAVDLLDLEVEELGDGVDPLTKQNFRVLFRGLQLMPWQPQQSAFILQRIGSVLRACINGDDTGLGKTVSTLTALVQNSLNIEKQREQYRAYHARYQALLEPYRPTAGDVEPLTDAQIIAAHGLKDAIRDLGQVPPNPPHKPVLIIVPPAGLNAWTSDAATYFSDSAVRRDIVVKTFFGSSGARATALERQLAVGTTAEELERYCTSLPSDQEITSRTCIIATYRSFASRCAYVKQQQPVSGAATESNDVAMTDLAPEIGEDMEVSADLNVTAAESALAADETPPAGDDIVDPDADEPEIDWDDTTDTTLGDGEMERVCLRIRDDLFGVCVIDEAQRVKNCNSLQAAAAYQQSGCAYILCTATPCINSVRDTYGLLRFLAKQVPIRHLAMGTEGPNHAAFADFAKHLRDDYHRDMFQIPPDKEPEYLSALDPENFRTRLGGGAGNVDLQKSHDIAGFVFMMTCLRRVMGDKLNVAGREIELGADIPSFEITFVELRQSDVEATLYRAAHQDALESRRASVMSTPEEDFEDNEHSPGSVRRRRLQHATLHPRLDQMYVRNVGTDAKGVQDLLKQGLDSFAVFHDWTSADIDPPALESRIAMAQYVVQHSAKLQALLDDIYSVVICEGRKMLVYADWPLNLWLIELLLSILQVGFLSIRAGVKTSKRLEAEYAYNNDPSTKVLVCSSRSAAESLNLQKGGWHIVVLDLVPFMTLMQIVGRGYRIGQAHAQTIKVLVADETYDQYLLRKYLTEYYGQIAAMAELPSGDTAEPDSHMQLLYKREAKKDEGYADWIQKILRETHVRGLARQVLGMRCDVTPEWGDVQNVAHKNTDPEQRLFRLAHGGAIAAQLLMQLGRPDGEPKVEPHRLTPFAAPMLARPVFTSEPPAKAYRKALIAAAREMCSRPAFHIKGITAIDCLLASKEWVREPSPHIDVALDWLRQGDAAREESDEEAEDDDGGAGGVDEEAHTQTSLPIRGATSGEEGVEAEGGGGPDERSAVAVDSNGPETVDDLSAEQRVRYHRHLHMMKNFRSKALIQRFAEMEFATQVEGRREEMEEAVAMAWVKRELDDQQEYHPVWKEEEGKKGWEGVAVRAAEGSAGSPVAK